MLLLKCVCTPYVQFVGMSQKYRCFCGKVLRLFEVKNIGNQSFKETQLKGNQENCCGWLKRGKINKAGSLVWGSFTPKKH